MFELVEESLDEVALAIEVSIDGALDLAIALGWDVGASAGAGDQIDQVLPVVAAIGDHVAGLHRPVQQCWSRCLVGGLAGGEQQPDGQAALIDQGVDLGAQSSTRTADGVIRAPFLPPAACWWARMMELSISCSDCGDCAASASNIRSHTPAFAQRLKRL